ncbi:MAG: pyruvate ferredoxin oxidoreductase [Dethiobacter sp.]|nr:pyruvate ferredoxin oxidoreductase [Dethiobacter sp.]
MAQKIITGNQAVAYAVKLARTQVISAFPITPQTTVVETLAEMWAQGEYTGEFVSVESENSALAYCIGAAYAGARAFTATSSHGLAYMHELLHWASGARLPLVMANANRALGAPWCIESDQIDSLAQRDTGWIQFYCSSVQEILDTVIFAFRLAEEVRLPVMVCYDGFYLSHTYEAAAIPEQPQVDSFLPAPARKPAFDIDNPENRHGLVSAEAMARLLNVRYRATEMAGEKYELLDQEFYRAFGRSYEAVEYFGPKQAGTLFLTAGGMAQTIKSFLTVPGREEALLRVKQFRPFPSAGVRDILSCSHVERVIVADRNVCMGVGGIFAQEVRAALYGLPHPPQVIELNLAGGVDLTPEMLEKALAAAPGYAADEKIMWAVELL